jgi:hypothetical protein
VIQNTQPGLLMQFLSQMLAARQPVQIPHQRLMEPPHQQFAGYGITIGQPQRQRFVRLDSRLTGLGYCSHGHRVRSGCHIP